MDTLTALRTLSDLCASQKGMFTAAQARAAGIDRMTVSRMARSGHVERVDWGIYRAAAAPSLREEDVYAAWLSLEPSKPAFERATDGSGCTASLNTAAWLLGIGELNATPITFSCPSRRQSSKGLVFLKRRLRDSDVTMAAGIPTTTPGMTVLDLIDHAEDLSLVSSVLKDAETAYGELGIAAAVNARAERCGFGSGFDLYSYLKGC